MKSHMEAISLRLTTMQSSMQMAKTMKGVTKAMGRMNAKMNLPQIQSIMAEFENQSEIMGVKEEMMDDAMEDAFADDNDEEEQQQVLDEIFAELGVDTLSKMSDAPSGQMNAEQPAAAAAGEASAAGSSAG